MPPIRRRVSVKRAMAGLAVLAVLLAAIRSMYDPALYCVDVEIRVLSPADRNPAAMESLAAQMVSPEVLAAASADPRLAALPRALRVPADDEPLRSSSGPAAYASVRTVPDGWIAVEGMGESEAEALAIAYAVADASVRAIGAGRVTRPASARTMHSAVVATTLSQPWHLAVAIGLALVAAAAVVLLPIPRPGRRATSPEPERASPPTLREWLAPRAAIAVAAVVGVAVIDSWLWISSPSVYVPASAMAAGAFALGGMRRPGLSLVIVLLLGLVLPTVYDSSGCTLFRRCLLGGWVLGTLAGWAGRGLRRVFSGGAARGPVQSEGRAAAEHR